MDDDFRPPELRFHIPEGSVPDMPCGGARNGVAYHNGIQHFRPQYFTVGLNSDGHMTELRLWGRQIKKDGSLGVRDLDYWWQWG